MKKIALLAAITLIPLSVYAYMADHSDSYDDYQAFHQQFKQRDGDHYHNMMFHKRDGHFGDFRHHHAYSHDQHHRETGTDCPGYGNGCAWLEGPAREAENVRYWFPHHRHHNG